jgi:hypothetical protein
MRSMVVSVRSNDRAVRARKLPFPEGVKRYIVAQDSA